MMTLTLFEIANAVGGQLFGNGEKMISGISTDSRKISPEEIFVALRGQKFDGHDFIPDLWGKCSAVITEEPAPGFDGVLVEDTLKALGILSAYWKKQVAPRFTVGVTGSVGKTTTKEMIASVLKGKYKTHCTAGNLNNHIGVPITLIRIDKDAEAVVCEMGMSGKGEIEYLSGLVRPNLAVITNIGTSHIEMLGSREGILEAKLEILSGMEEGSTIVLDGDEPLLRSEKVQKTLSKYKVVYVGFDSGNDVYPLDIYKGGDHLSFDIIAGEREFRVKVPAVGDHFVKNTLFAASVGILCGVDDETIQNGILSYSPSGFRQKIYYKDDIRIIADCYNASPESMEASLKVLGESKGRKIAVLGDMLELGCLAESAHKKVGEQAFASGTDYLFTYGKVSYHIMLGAVENGMDKDRCLNSIDKDQTAHCLKKILKPGDTVLFKASRKMKL
ncbi:MAG: UDP-N-acetylmuramoyl-tripeptide--D-alanyl-D-alanine ligase, partial [Clostridia bacterium]|nr:UDP-N-acetylmuramoyl-tripeptide--D-alanyl-D-alanine ligase [Clostridia bacterium]